MQWRSAGEMGRIKIVSFIFRLRTYGDFACSHLGQLAHQDLDVGRYASGIVAGSVVRTFAVRGAHFFKVQMQNAQM